MRVYRISPLSEPVLTALLIAGFGAIFLVPMVLWVFGLMTINGKPRADANDLRLVFTVVMIGLLCLYYAGRQMVKPYEIRVQGETVHFVRVIGTKSFALYDINSIERVFWNTDPEKRNLLKYRLEWPLGTIEIPPSYECPSFIHHLITARPSVRVADVWDEQPSD